MSRASPRVLIVYYSLHGHIEKLASAVAKGAKAAGGDVVVRRVPETLSKAVLKKMRAKKKNKRHAEATPADLAAADCIIFGIPTRFGMAAAQVKALMDRTGKLWMTGGLIGKCAGVFVSTGSQGGGQETTALTFVTQLVHHGMIYVPIGYAKQDIMLDMKEIRGGSAYGAGCFAGDGSRLPTKDELALATFQGDYTTRIAARLLFRLPEKQAMEKETSADSAPGVAIRGDKNTTNI